jgi:hypothetical protein
LTPQMTLVFRETARRVASPIDTFSLLRDTLNT